MMKARTYIMLFGLLMVAQGMVAQGVRSCPMRIVPGDPRNMGQEKQMMQADRQRRIAEAQNATMHTPGICTRTLPPRVLVIMVNFKDWTFSTSKAHADSLFNTTALLSTDRGWVAVASKEEQVIKHGSVATYFNDQSLGQYRPKFDVVGPVTINKSYIEFPGTSGGPSLAKAACTAVNDSVDFTQYDSDKDGYIDLVFLFYAGFGQNDKDYIDPDFGVDANKLIWPHYSTVSGTNKFDGKILRAYECSNELDGFYSTAEPLLKVPAGSGILVHEFSHAMGLPDVYAGSNQYMGKWDLMDYGCYNAGTYIPSSYTGWQRWFMGWSKPQWMNEAKDVTLRPISESGDFGVITSNGQRCDSMNTSPYWIVENHQRTGWDEYAPGQGLILYQLKYHGDWRSNSVNSESNKRYVMLPADGILRSGGLVGKQGDCYPYGTLDSIKVAPNYPITAIKQESDSSITFKVCGGTPTPTGLGEGAKGRNGEEAKWLNGEKVWRNGTLYIRRGNHLYSPMGQIVK